MKESKPLRFSKSDSTIKQKVKDFRRKSQEAINFDSSNPSSHYMFLLNIFSFLPYETEKDKIQSLKVVAEVLKGGQIHIPGMHSYHLWLEYPDNHLRLVSSHKSDDNQYVMTGSLLTENLFGTRDGYSWFQSERSSTNGRSFFRKLKNNFCHLMDYIEYKYTGKNIGPYGNSEYTEKNPFYLEKALGYDKGSPLTTKKENSDFWKGVLFGDTFCFHQDLVYIMFSNDKLNGDRVYRDLIANFPVARRLAAAEHEVFIIVSENLLANAKDSINYFSPKPNGKNNSNITTNTNNLTILGQSLISNGEPTDVDQCIEGESLKII